MLELHIILILMIVAAIAAIEMKDMLSSIIALGAVGLGLGLQFLLLRAPDLAITQLVVEILSLVILIRATVGTNISSKLKAEPGYLVCALVFAAAFLWQAFKALAQLPVFGNAIMKVGSQYNQLAAAKTGAANVVTAIVLDFRGYDTLGEATILFTAVVGVLAVLRKVGRQE